MLEIPKPLTDIAAEIAAGEAVIRELPDVLDHALIGSASYMTDVGDVDFAVLVDDSHSAVEYADRMASDGFLMCGDYDGVGGTWAAVRRQNLNLMITHDPKFFSGYKTATEVCKALKLVNKLDRIAVCQIVRDGKTAADVVTSAPAQTCPCFPGTCRGGEVVNGVLANGSRCRAQS